MTYISVVKTANKYWDTLKKKRITRFECFFFLKKKKFMQNIFILTKLSTAIKQAKINFYIIVNYSFKCLKLML